MPVRKPSKYGNNLRAPKSSVRSQKPRTIDASEIRSSEGTSQDEKMQAIKLRTIESYSEMLN